MNEFDTSTKLPAPQTFAGQLHESRTQGDSLMVDTTNPVATDGLLPIEVASQTYPGFDEAGDSTADSSEEETVELYDYESDGAFESIGDSTRTLFRWIGRGTLVPAGEVKLGEDGDRFNLTINVRGQKPTVTARQAYDQAKEISHEINTALVESVQEIMEETEVKPDNEATAAVAFVCMQLITHYAEQDDTNSRVSLTSMIRQNHPDILQDSQFRSVMKRFGKDPESFKLGFANIENREAIVEELPLVTAFHEFVEAHDINTEDLFGGAL